jgi:hypothetical protein
VAKKCLTSKNSSETEENNIILHSMEVRYLQKKGNEEPKYKKLIIPTSHLELLPVGLIDFIRNNELESVLSDAKYEIPDLVFSAFNGYHPKTILMVATETGISPERIKMLVRKWEREKYIWSLGRVCMARSPITGDYGSFYTTNGRVWGDMIAGKRGI